MYRECNIEYNMMKCNMMKCNMIVCLMLKSTKEVNAGNVYRVQCHAECKMK